MKIWRRDFLTGALAAASSGDASGCTVLNVGQRKQLFIDGMLIAAKRGIALRPSSPRLPEENLLPADRPWDAARAGSFSTILDDGRLRLWYSAYDSLVPFKVRGPGATRFSGDRICYAESDDGLRFRKPALGVVGAFGSKANNIVMPGSGPCVFPDPFAGAGSRYRMLLKGTHFDFFSSRPGEEITARAIFRADRLVAAEADSAGELLTHAIRFSGATLRVNVDAGRQGHLRVGLADAEGRGITGFSEEECDPITGDRRSAVVSWKGRTQIGHLARYPIRLRFRMESCGLYAFQFGA